jgi:hypothetical protein
MDIVRVEARDQAAGVLRREGFDGGAPTAGLLDDFGLDRQRAMSTGADDQQTSAPGELLVSRHGVCPNSERYGLEGFLLRFRTRPPSMTMSCS